MLTVKGTFMKYNSFMKMPWVWLTQSRRDIYLHCNLLKFSRILSISCVRVIIMSILLRTKRDTTLYNPVTYNFTIEWNKNTSLKARKLGMYLTPACFQAFLIPHQINIFQTHITLRHLIRLTNGKVYERNVSAISGVYVYVATYSMK